MPLEWWLRPVSSAARVGPQMAVVWKRVKRRPFLGERVELRRRDQSAEGGGLAEAHIVEQDHDDVGGALGRGDGFLPVGGRVLVGLADFALEGRERNRQGGAVGPVLGLGNRAERQHEWQRQAKSWEHGGSPCAARCGARRRRGHFARLYQGGRILKASTSGSPEGRAGGRGVVSRRGTRVAGSWPLVARAGFALGQGRS